MQLCRVPSVPAFVERSCNIKEQKKSMSVDTRTRASVPNKLCDVQHAQMLLMVETTALGSYLKQFDICVEQVTLGDMNALEAELVNELQDPSGDDCLSACAGAGKGSLRLRIFQDNAIQFWDIDLVAFGP